MTPKILRVAALTAALISLIQPARANVALPHLFSDHMVVQQEMPVPVWGTASPGEHITISLNESHAAVTADASGKWLAKLGPQKAGGPFVMTVAGQNTLKVQDVLIGEVWLCSGQSNMDFTVAQTPKYAFAGTQNEVEEVKAANYPEIRMFKGDWAKAATPQTDVGGEWKVCTPENVREFSAIGYFFARDLQKALKVPVGIVAETFGASTAESWIPREALAANPDLKPMLDKFDAALAKYQTTYPAANLSADQAAAKKFDASVAAAEAADLAAWKANPNEVSKVPVGRGPRNHDPVQDQHNPTVMYNGMIAPIVPYAIQGVLWYQGESIVGGEAGIKLYPEVQKTLIETWRQLWGREDLPFYIVQLAALNSSNHSNKPTVREAQATVLALPHTGMAVTIDIGDPKSVHPKDKQDVGDRLTRIALANVYGQDIEFAGPMYDSMKVEDGKIRVSFTHAKDGLVAKGGDVKWFTIAGADGKYVPATAQIDGSTVVVSSPAVPNPVAVQYAWVEYPEGVNLYNQAGLPAAPFRTDPNSVEPAPPVPATTPSAAAANSTAAPATPAKGL